MTADIGPGTRLLCVETGGAAALVEGHTYTCWGVRRRTSESYCYLHGTRDHDGVELQEVRPKNPRTAYCVHQFVPLGGDHLPESLREMLDHCVRPRVPQPTGFFRRALQESIEAVREDLRREIERHVRQR